MVERKPLVLNDAGDIAELPGTEILSAIGDTNSPVALLLAQILYCQKLQVNLLSGLRGKNKVFFEEEN